MKTFLKVIGGVILSAALVVGGYAAGSHNGINTISSALPRVSINHGEPSAHTDVPKNAVPEDKDKDIEKALDEKEQMDKAAEPVQTGRTVVKTESSAAEKGWTKVKDYECALMDNSEASVSVYTSAETVDGEIIWDDGQQWVVEIYDGRGYYTLMDKYITNGSVYFDVTDTDGKKAVNVYTKTGCSTDIKQYTYSENGFVETTLYSSGTTNILYSTLPDYE